MLKNLLKPTEIKPLSQEACDNMLIDLYLLRKESKRIIKVINDIIDSPDSKIMETKKEA